MTEDLVKRLRSKNCCDATKCNCDIAADRIEQLEAALRDARAKYVELDDRDALEAIINIINKALGDECNQTIR